MPKYGGRLSVTDARASEQAVLAEPHKVIIGYARVSTDGRTLDAQQSALSAAGAEWVFAEKVSGAITDRRQLAKALAALAPGDTLIVTKLDRLARSTRDLLNTLDAIGSDGASFRSLGDFLGRAHHWPNPQRLTIFGSDRRHSGHFWRTLEMSKMTRPGHRRPDLL
jgi:Resolvase, N terminal domain